MKKFLLLLMFASSAWADDWTREDTYRQIAITTLQVVDWGQTRYIAKHPEFHEVNPLIGSHPSIGRVNNYFAVSIPANWAISALFSRRYRETWQYARGAAQLSLILYNRRIGIGMEF